LENIFVLQFFFVYLRCVKKSKMNKNEIINLVKGTPNSNKSIPLADFLKLKEIAKINLEIDRNTNDYYYKVSVDDLVDKEFDVKLLTDYGWEVTLGEDFIILYI